MAITTFDSDLSIIQKLSDEPNDIDGLSAAALKAKFDEAGKLTQTYLNDTMIPSTEGYVLQEIAKAVSGNVPVFTKDETLTAETAAALGLPADAVPNDAFFIMDGKVGDIIATQRKDIQEDTRFVECLGQTLLESDYPELSNATGFTAMTWVYSSVNPIDNYGDTWVRTQAGSVIIGRSNGVYKSVDKGMTFNRVKECGFTTNLTLLASGRIIGNLDSNQMHYSDDDGDTWLPSSVDINHSWQHYVQTNTGRVIAFYVAKQYNSDDNGETFVQVVNTFTEYSQNILVTEDNTLIATGWDRYSIDDGDTWIPCVFVGGAGANFHSFFLSSTGKLFSYSGYSTDSGKTWMLRTRAGNVDFQTRTGRLMGRLGYSDDDGDTWIGPSSGNTMELGGQLEDGMIIWSVGPQGWFSIDNGETRQKFSSNHSPLDGFSWSEDESVSFGVRRTSPPLAMYAVPVLHLPNLPFHYIKTRAVL